MARHRDFRPDGAPKLMPRPAAARTSRLLGGYDREWLDPRSAEIDEAVAIFIGHVRPFGGGDEGGSP